MPSLEGDGVDLTGSNSYHIHEGGNILKSAQLMTSASVKALKGPIYLKLKNQCDSTVIQKKILHFDILLNKSC